MKGVRMSPTEILINMGLSMFSIVVSAGIGIIVKSIVDRNRRKDAIDDERARRFQENEEKHKAEYDALKSGVCAILRDRLIQVGIHSSITGVTAEQKTNVELMYKAYHQLGGNGIVTNVYQHIMDMPLVGESNDQNDYHPL